ncbi:MAG: hypothetical protein F6K42_30455 [Leptolyngbya sp. SIO1D8]|nr:hypothetical protein [Leptolyngbya sp. SIO1D8]
MSVLPLSILVISDLLLGGQRSTIDRYLIPAYIGALLTLGFGVSGGILKRPTLSKFWVRAKQVVLYAVLAMAISGAWFNFQSATWWGKPDIELETANLIRQNTEHVTILSNERLGDFMSFAFLLRPTDQIVWFRSMTDLDLDNILENSNVIFLVEPSEAMLKQFQNFLDTKHHHLEFFYGETFQIKPDLKSSVL